MDSIVPLSKIPMLKSSSPSISEYGYVWALISYNWCLYKKWGSRGARIHTEKTHVRTKREDDHLQGKKRGLYPADTLILDF